jgi:glycosyltransferase involved in cell wall biosynthesis
MAELRSHGIAAVLAIAGHGAHEPVLRARAVQLGIDRSVRFLGTLPPAELALLLQISDIFAMMSTSETQSMALLQAMASGVPVVAADTRALPEFVGPASGVLVDPCDSARLADVLAELLGAPDRRRLMGSAGRRVAERYAIETITDEWEALYRSVLKRGPTA